MDDDFDHNASWYDITIEEEERIEKENVYSVEGRRPVINTILYPLEEADTSIEEAEELTFNIDAIHVSTPTSQNTPVKSRLGPRASKRHYSTEKQQSNEPMSEERVFSRLGPRASLRHATTDSSNNKRNSSHRQESCPANKKSRKSGTPTRGTSTRNTYRTPTSQKTPLTKTAVTPQDFKTPDNSGCKKTPETPNTDSKLYVKKRGKALNFDEENKPSDSRKRFTSESSSSSVTSTTKLTENQIAQREKQVMYGKVTDGYENYKAIIPKSMRLLKDPRTPQKSHPYSKRCWDGLVKTWRRRLHEWDNPRVGLAKRSVYSKNNNDLKQAGLITDDGEIVMFIHHEVDNNSELPGTTQEDLTDEYGITKCSNFTLKTDFMTTQDTDHMTSLHQSEEGCDPPHQTQDIQAEWLKRNLEQLNSFIDNDDARSQDSDYGNLIRGVDLPEYDDSDTDYRLSQDADFEEMDCEESDPVRQHFPSSTRGSSIVTSSTYQEARLEILLKSSVNVHNLP